MNISDKYLRGIINHIYWGLFVTMLLKNLNGYGYR